MNPNEKPPQAQKNDTEIVELKKEIVALKGKREKTNKDKSDLIALRRDLEDAKKEARPKTRLNPSQKEELRNTISRAKTEDKAVSTSQPDVVVPGVFVLTDENKKMQEEMDALATKKSHRDVQAEIETATLSETNQDQKNMEPKFTTPENVPPVEKEKTQTQKYYEGYERIWGKDKINAEKTTESEKTINNWQDEAIKKYESSGRKVLDAELVSVSTTPEKPSTEAPVEKGFHTLDMETAEEAIKSKESADGDAIIKKEFEKLSPEEQKKVELGLQNIGFLVEEKKNKLFAGVFNFARKKLEEVGLLKKREYVTTVDGKEEKRTQAGFLDNWLLSFSENMTKNAEASRKKMENAERTSINQLASLGSVTGNALKYGRAITDLFGVTSLVSPLRYVMMGGMIFGGGLNAGKEARFKNEEVLEKTRVQDINAAAEEAWKIYKEASAGKEKIESKDLEKAYLDNAPQDILNRLKKDAEPGTASSILQKVIKKDIEMSIGSINTKLEKIDSDSELDDISKKIEREKIIQKYEQHIKDLDRAVTQFGTVDTLALGAKYGETAAKAVVAGLMIETAALAIDKLWEKLPSILGGTTGGSASVEAGVQNLTPNETAKIKSDVIPEVAETPKPDDLPHEELPPHPNVISLTPEVEIAPEVGITPEQPAVPTNPMTDEAYAAMSAAMERESAMAIVAGGEVINPNIPVEAGSMKGDFQYSPSGEVVGFVTNELGASANGRELLNDDWRSVVRNHSINGMTDGLNIGVVDATATKIAGYEQVLNALEQKGDGGSLEAGFLREQIQSTINEAEKTYGDVFKDPAVGRPESRVHINLPGESVPVPETKDLPFTHEELEPLPNVVPFTPEGEGSFSPEIQKFAKEVTDINIKKVLGSEGWFGIGASDGKEIFKNFSDRSVDEIIARKTNIISDEMGKVIKMLEDTRSQTGVSWKPGEEIEGYLNRAAAVDITNYNTELSAGTPAAALNTEKLPPVVEVKNIVTGTEKGPGYTLEKTGVASAISGSTGKELLSSDYTSNLKESGAGLNFDQQMATTQSRSITSQLEAYRELLSAGKTEEAAKQLGALRTSVDMADKSLGVGVIDRSKIPELKLNPNDIMMP